MSDSRPFLMVPGPVEVESDVLAEMSRPVVTHYGPAWVELYNQTVDMLKKVFKTRHDLYIFVSSGSGALDGAIGTLLAPGDKAILVINGFFGERLKEIATSHGVVLAEVHAEWGTAVSPAAIEKAIAANLDAKAVILTHCETSTGVLNPIRQIGAITRKANIPLVVDAITSIGGEEYDMDGWGADITVTASQKALACPPGLAAVAISPRAWEAIDARKTPPVGWYLNLANWRHYIKIWGDWHPYPMTMATNNVLALRQSLLSLMNQGIDERIAQHRLAAITVRDAIRKMGLRLVAEESCAAHTVTSIEAPTGKKSEELLAHSLKVHNVQLANGMGATKNRWFRIGHMGCIGTKPQSIERAIKAVADFLK